MIGDAEGGEREDSPCDENVTGTLKTLAANKGGGGWSQMGEAVNLNLLRNFGLRSR